MHLHANKLVHYIHQVAKSPDMSADAQTMYGATLDKDVRDLSLKTSPVTTECFDAMFTYYPQS